MVKLDGVSKRYPGRQAPALAKIDLTVAAGEFLFVTGPSGAGKTTLLRLLYAAEFPSEGSVVVGGVDLGHLGKRRLPLLRRRLGVILQDFRLLPRLSAFENVALALRVAGRRGRKLVTLVEHALEQVDLADKALVRTSNLSGGEQQRVAIARAMVKQPPLVLADEPTGNLDPENAHRVMSLMSRAHQGGVTVLVATHDPSLLPLVPAARQVKLRLGRLEEQG